MKIDIFLGFVSFYSSSLILGSVVLELDTIRTDLEMSPLLRGGFMGFMGLIFWGF